MLAPFEIPPGILRAGTEYQSRGRWFDANLVRFYAGTIQPMGGFRQVNSSALDGRPCAMLGWRPDSATIGRYLAIGTNEKAYVYDGDTVYDITPGSFTTGAAEATSTQGYGAGTYGTGDYGTPRTGTGGSTPVDNWHFDTWGEYLVGCFTADGRLLEWDLDTADTFQVIANAPTTCKGLVVSAERMMFALSPGGDIRKFAWSDQEDNTNWTPSPTSTAGDLSLTTDGKIITGERVRGGIMIHTDTDAHLVSYIGAPFYYGVEKVGDNCGIVSAGAKVSAGAITAWMSPNGFYLWDGYVKPIPCDVYDYVFSRINRSQISKVSAWHNGEWGEIWWFYPADGGNRNNRYVVWNYREGHWNIGAIRRTCGVSAGAWPFPLCADDLGNWYEHETGTDSLGSSRYIESGPTEIAPGERFVWLNQVIHDESDNANFLQLSIKTRLTPESAETTFGPYALSASNGYTDIRAQGRAYKMRLDEVTAGAWRVGTMRFDMRQGGKR